MVYPVNGLLHHYFKMALIKEFLNEDAYQVKKLEILKYHYVYINTKTRHR